MKTARGYTKWAALALFGLFFVYPLARFLLLPVWPRLGPPGGATVAATAGVAVAARNSLLLGTLAAIVSAPTGAAIAWWMEYRSGWIARAQALGLWLLFFTPSYVLTTGWQTVFTLPALGSGAVQRTFYGPLGIVFMLALKALPFATFVARPSWSGMGAELLDAMRVHRIPAMRRGILLTRLAIPALAAAFVVGFIESVQDFGIPATLGATSHLPLLTYAIYESVSTSPLDFAGAARLAWILMAMAGAAAALHWYVQRRYRFALASGRRKNAGTHGEARAAAGAAALATALLWLLGLLAPGLAICVSAASRNGSGDLSSLANSCGFAVIAATVAVAVATAFARAIVLGNNRWFAGLEGFSLVNMAVPGLILGAAYLMAFNGSWLPLYGTPLLLILGYVAGTSPMLTRLLQPPLAHIDRSLLDSARVHGLSWAARVFDIEGMLMSAPLSRGWTLAFGAILFELPISALLYPAGRTPLGVSIMNLDQEFRFAAASRLALAGIGVALGVGALVALLLRAGLPQPARKRSR